MNSNNKCRGVAQFGSALVSGTRGREFESRRPDQIKNFRNRMRMRFFLFLRLNTVFELLFPSGVSSLRGVQIVPLFGIMLKILLPSAFWYFYFKLFSFSILLRELFHKELSW